MSRILKFYGKTKYTFWGFQKVGVTICVVTVLFDGFLSIWRIALWYSEAMRLIFIRALFHLLVVWGLGGGIALLQGNLVVWFFKHYNPTQIAEGDRIITVSGGPVAWPALLNSQDLLNDMRKSFWIITILLILITGITRVRNVRNLMSMSNQNMCMYVI